MVKKVSMEESILQLRENILSSFLKSTSVKQIKDPVKLNYIMLVMYLIYTIVKAMV